MNWKNWLAGGAVSLGTGIVLYDGVPYFSLPVYIAAAVCLVGLLLLVGWKTGIRGAALAGSIFFILALGFGRMALSEARWEQSSLWAVGSSGTFTGIITEAPLVQKTGDPYARYSVELEAVRYPDGDTKKLTGTAYVYDPDISRIYQTGDRISVQGKLSELRIYQNPGKIDLSGRYKSRRLLGRIYTETQDSVRLLGNSGDFLVRRTADTIRSSLMEKFSSYMDPVRLHILMTLLFGGSYNEIPEAVMTSFSATGIVHILSVSGSHVALLFGFLYFLGKWLRLPPKITLAGAIFLVLAYAVLAGLVPPVIRAAVMGILSVGGIFLDREKSSLNLLGAAVSGMLLWDPFYLFDVSFQLSAGASAGILIFYRPLLQFLEKLSFLPQWIREGISLSTAAQVLTVPIILYDFHVFPLFFIPANLLVTPFLEWVIIAGILAAVISVFFLPLAAGILYLSDYLLWGSIRLNFFLAGLPKASLQTGGITICQGGLYYWTILLLYFRKTLMKRKRLFRLSLSFWGILAALTAYLWFTAPAVRAYVPDLGGYRGAVLTWEGKRILYYRGSRMTSHTAAWEWLSFLQYEGIFSADVLILNLEDVKDTLAVSSVPVREIWAVGGDPRKLCPELLKEAQGKIRILKKGKISLDDLSVETNGSSFLIRQGDRGCYISGNKGMNDRKFPSHVLWLAGPLSYGLMLSDRDIRRVSPEAVLYAGSAMTSSYEDTELFAVNDIPAVNVRTDGMRQAVLDENWKIEERLLWQ